MKKTILFPILLAIIALQAKADEGMWMLTQLSQKYQDMVKRGLQLKEYDIYNPNGSSLRDAVVMFDGGCTGEIISDKGLVLTNHHCGYDYIQAHSSLEHNYLDDGFWAKSFTEELPCPGLEVSFIENIEDVTPIVKKMLKGIKDPMLALSPRYLATLAPKIPGKAELQKKEHGIRFTLKAFYGGNKYYLFTERVYQDVRFVAAPPSSIGKYGADTDNWVWPRHAGDISIFRIYANKNNQPAEYSKDNVPLQPKRHFKISLDGVKDGDFAMIMGFPGRTYNYFTPSQVEQWKTIDNDIRIQMRGIRQDVMLQEMLADPQIKIMYSAKYASSQNAYKRAQGANWAIANHGLIQDKQRMQSALLSWSKTIGTDGQIYPTAVDDINKIVAEQQALKRQLWYLEEGPIRSIEFIQCPHKDNYFTNGSLDELKKEFNKFFNKDYSPMVDKKVAIAILSTYIKEIPLADQPEEIQRISTQYKGNVRAYINDVFAQSIFSSSQAFNKFISKPNATQYENDPMVKFARSVINKYRQITQNLKPYDDRLALAHKTYVGGIMKMNEGRQAIWPDANLTLRFTYGNIKGYSPRDAVYYDSHTTLKGVMEKEDPNNWEYNVCPGLKKVYQTKDYGPYGNPDKTMNVDFCATTHTTGGNSGSPVINAKGELIGINFDRNWEGVGGDIQYLPNYQRSIICDIRYVMLIIDKVGGCQRLTDEILHS